MSEHPDTAKAALICVDPQGSSPDVLGKSLPQRQLEFALAAGCGQVIILGDGAAPEAIAIRHRAEAAKAKVQVVSGPHALARSLPAGSQLLVLQAGLLPESREALDALSGGPAILALPAGAGIQAGFERIDLERAWAGALIMPGALLDRLLDLPEDSDAPSALLRIGLQHRLAERRLGEGSLADGSWAMITPGADTGLLRDRWFDRHLSEAPRCAVARRIAGWLLRRFRDPLLEAQHAPLAILSGALLACLGAVALAHYDMAALGFALIATSVPLLESAAGLSRLKAAPFKSPGLARHVTLLADAAILAAGYLAIEGSWPRQLFPPLVLLVALHAQSTSRSDNPLILLRDRTMLCVILAIFAAFELTEEGIMAAALLVLLANHLSARRLRG